MLLQLHEWGERTAPPVVCLHGVTGHGSRARRLADEVLAARFRVLAPDLRGHGFSEWEPPWTIATHVADVLETVEAAGVESATWIGHSFGGRLVLEIAAAAPERVERALLLDPAIQLMPHVGLMMAEDHRRERVFDSPEAAVVARLEMSVSTPREAAEEEAREHLAQEGGSYRFRYCQSAVVSAYGELCTPAPPPETLRAPALLVHAPGFGLVREDQIHAYGAACGDRLELVEVSGGHMVFWDAWEETAGAVRRFLAAF